MFKGEWGYPQSFYKLTRVDQGLGGRYNEQSGTYPFSNPGRGAFFP
jgi:hypothetical protein